MKKALIVGAVLLALGIILSLGGFAAMGFDFSNLLTANHVTRTYTPEGDFSDISVTGVTCDIRVAKSEDDTCKVILMIDDRYDSSVEVQSGKLSIHVEENLKWYQQIGFFSGKNTITVYLPEKDYHLLEAKAVTGDITLESGFRFSDVIIHATTGDIHVSSLSCEKISIKVTTGDIDLRDVLTETMSLKATTGDIKLSSCDGNQMDIRNTTGDVKGTLRTGKQFTAHATTGDVRVPSDSGTGTCNIKTTTGNIEITVE